MPKFTLGTDPVSSVQPDAGLPPLSRRLLQDNKTVGHVTTPEAEKLVMDAVFVRNYIAFATRTESRDSDSAVRVIRCLRLLHAGMGLCTEAGEFQDNLKKHIFYGKPLDEVNLMEEVGDFFWYLGLTLDVLGYDWVEVMRRNIDKLKVRFPEKFEALQALERNLDAERAALEKK